MDIFKLVGSIVVNNGDANKAIDETAKKGQSLAQTVGSSMQSAGQTIQGVGKKLAPASIVMAGALTASTKSASDFQNGMSKMSTLFDTTQVSVSDLSKEFLTLSSQSGVSATELAEAGYQALSAGVNVNNSVEFVKTASNLARAGFTSTSTAVDVLTTAMNAYGEEAGTAEEISNKLVRTQNLGKTTVDELASSMGKVIPTASAMGVNIDNLTSGYVSLTKQGIATAEATTYMNGMLNELGDSGTQLGGIIREKTGMSFQECMESGMSLADVLQITKDYADENGIAYNELWGSMEAGKAGLAILNGGVDEFNATMDTMSSKSDDVGDALEKLDTPSVKLNRSLNQLKNSGIELGTALLTALTPTLDVVCGAISSLTNWFSGLPDPVKTVIVTIMGIIAIASPLLIVIGKVISSVGTIITTVPTIVGAISTIGNGLKVLWGIMMANPIVLIIAGIVALIAVFVHLWNTSESFRNFWIGLWEGIKTAFATAWEGIKTIVTNVVGAIKSFLEGAWNAISGTVSSVWNGIKNTFSGILNGIQTVFTSVWNAISGTVSGVINAIKNTISGGLNAISGTVTSVLNGIKNTFSNIWNGAVGLVKGAVDKLKGLVNFSWELPKIKLPHFSINGSFSLNPPSIPTIGVDWYKKAMDDGFMFTKPTIFGANSNGGLMGAGEAGDEVMIGKDNMLNMIQTAVSNETTSILTAIQDVINQVLDKMDDVVGQGQGDIVIPVYLGNNMVDEVIVDAKKRVTLRSGGMTNV